MKICVSGAPSTGKSAFARALSGEMTKRGMSCELIPEYASTYIQRVGLLAHFWEQIVIAEGQKMNEVFSREYIVAEGGGFVPYVYAKRALSCLARDENWEKYRNVLDMVHQMSRQSIESYDTIFLLSHVFEPKNDGVRLSDHLSFEQCQEIGEEIEGFLQAERSFYHVLDTRDADCVNRAIDVIQESVKVRV